LLRKATALRDRWRSTIYSRSGGSPPRARRRCTTDGPGFRSYVAQVIRWRIQDAYCEEMRHPRPSRTTEEFDAAVSTLSHPGFADRAMRRIDLQRAMRQLRPDYRRVLFEVQVLDRPYRDVADDRGMTLGALKALHHRALEQLRQLEAEAA
jgi:RNA polymerase sigma factor (sigma-70 family)